MKLNRSHISIIKRLLSANNQRSLKSILEKSSSKDLASLFTQLNNLEKHRLFTSLMNLGEAPEMFFELPESQAFSFLKTISQDEFTQLLILASEDKCAYFLSSFEEEKQKEILSRLSDSAKSRRIQQFLNYHEDSAGRLMDSQVFTIPVHFKSQEALEYLKSQAGQISIYYIYCTDKDNTLQGVLNLRDLAIADNNTPLAQLIKKDVVTLSPDTSLEEVAKIVSHYNFIAIPVVTKEKKLLGVVTIDSVLEILEEEITSNIYSQVGLQENDKVFSSFSFKFKNRLPWMTLNLALAGLASLVINYFENTIQDLIILASLTNVVAGIGGSTAIQTMTVMTRGLATGDFKFITKNKAVIKEILVGTLLGLSVGVMACLLVYVWKGSFLVSSVIFASLLINCFLASLLGATIPLVMNKLRMDPAIGSSVLVIMFTDIFSFFSFLGIATLGLKWFGAF